MRSRPHAAAEETNTPLSDLRLLLSPPLTPDQLFAFYEKNDVCEKGFGKEVAARVLDHSDVIVGAFRGDDQVAPWYTDPGGGPNRMKWEDLERRISAAEAQSSTPFGPDR